MHILERLVGDVRLRFPRVEAKFDFAVEENVSWVDLRAGNREVVVSWSQSHGFGISADPDPAYFTHHSDEVYGDYDAAMERVVALFADVRASTVTWR